jgi:hypothetical protein
MLACLIMIRYRLTPNGVRANSNLAYVKIPKK